MNKLQYLICLQRLISDKEQSLMSRKIFFSKLNRVLVNSLDDNKNSHQIFKYNSDMVRQSLLYLIGINSKASTSILWCPSNRKTQQTEKESGAKAPGAHRVKKQRKN